MFRWALIALSLPFFAQSVNAAEGLAYEDNKLNFRNCKGENVTARSFEEKFSLSRAGVSPSDPEVQIEYSTWDGGCAKFSWDAAKTEFLTTTNGAEVGSRVVKYVAWDGGKWMATRTGGGFYISRVANSGDNSLSRANYADAAHWLKRQDPNHFGAVTLIEALTKAASSE